MTALLQFSDLWLITLNLLLPVIWYLVTFVTVGFAIIEKVDIWRKVLNIYIAVFLPVLGSILYWVLRWRDNRMKSKKQF